MLYIYGKTSFLPLKFILISLNYDDSPCYLRVVSNSPQKPIFNPLCFFICINVTEQITYFTNRSFGSMFEFLQVRSKGFCRMYTYSLWKTFLNLLACQRDHNAFFNNRHLLNKR